MTWRRAVGLTVWSSLASVVTQVIAVLTLDPAAFGTFALAMLGYGLCSSLSLSLVGEAWMRDDRQDAWPRYSSALVALAALAGGVGLVLAAVLASPTAALLAVAIGLSTYRLGARFHALSTGALRYVGPADVATFLVTVAGWALAAQAVEPLMAVAIGWLAGAVVSVAMSRPPRLERRGVRTWLRVHAASIRTLLLDAAMLDASVIGVPLLLAPLLGLRDFGVYRALSSAAVPVRLALSPLRPILAGVDLGRSMSTRSLLALAAGGLAVGAAVGGAIVVVDGAGLARGTVLDLLAEHALAVAAFTAASMPLYAAQMIARSRLAARPLLVFRLSSLVLGAILPLVGFATLALTGALWGAAAAALVDAVVIVVVLRRARRREAAATPSPQR